MPWPLNGGIPALNPRPEKRYRGDGAQDDERGERNKENGRPAQEKHQGRGGLFENPVGHH